MIVGIIQRLVIAVGLLLISVSLNAAELDRYFASYQAPTFKKSVVSLRERKFLNLVAQQVDYSCGAAAVATILQYSYGIRVDEQAVIEGMLAVSDEAIVQRRGFSLLDIKHYLERVGFRGRGYEVPVAYLSQMKVPTIALVEIEGYQHFVVLRKVVGDLVFIADPARGNQTLSLEEFSDAWAGVVFAIIGEDYNRHAKLANPDPPLTLKYNRDDYLPATPVELVALGFRREQIL